MRTAAFHRLLEIGRRAWQSLDNDLPQLHLNLPNVQRPLPPQPNLRNARAMRPVALGSLAFIIGLVAQRSLSVDGKPEIGLYLYLIAIVVLFIGWAATSENVLWVGRPGGVERAALGELLAALGRRLAGSGVESSGVVGQRQDLALSDVKRGLIDGIRAAIRLFYGGETPSEPVPRQPEPSAPAKFDLRALVARHRPDLRLDAGQLTEIERQYALAGLAVLINVLGVLLLAGSAFRSMEGGLLWFASLVLLLAAFRRQRRATVPVEWPSAERASTSRPWVELALLGCILLGAALFRFYRLGDLTTGLHGDESEFGLLGIRILGGEGLSPFVAYFAIPSLPNVHAWAVAVMMAVFGQDVLGLRMFSALAGTLMIIPVYALARMWFGTRAALMAAALLAASMYAVHLSRQALGFIVVPLSLVLALYFLFRSLRTGRMLETIAAGYAAGVSLYFHFAGHLNLLVLLLVVAHMFVFVPATRAIRAAVSRKAGLFPALSEEVKPLSAYAGQILMLFAAMVCMSSVSLAYMVDRPEAPTRMQHMSLFRQEANVPSTYQATHEPIYLAPRFPTGDGLVGVLPISLTAGPGGLKLMDDGFWARALFRQLLATLGGFAHLPDVSSFFPWGYPIVAPWESVLLVLGMGWATLRWQDSRFASLAIAFWLHVTLAGAFSAGTPNVQRIVGVIPLLSIASAYFLDRLVREAESVVHSRVDWQPSLRPVVFAVPACAAIVMVGWIAISNVSTYHGAYLGQLPFRGVTALAVFVREIGQEYQQRSLSPPIFRHLGLPRLGWDGPLYRFLNRGFEGKEIVNLSDELPLAVEPGRDVVFLIWPWNEPLLTTIAHYYPGAEARSMRFGPPPGEQVVLTAYLVPSELIAERRNAAGGGLVGTFESRSSLAAGAQAPTLRESRRDGFLSFQRLSPVPGAESVTGSWRGTLLIREAGRFRFEVVSNSEAVVVLTGRDLVRTPPAPQGVVTAQADASLEPGEYPLEIRYTSVASSRVLELYWTPPDGQRRLLGPGDLVNGPASDR